MKLRNAEGYNIGLDLGTNSVGWSVIGHDGTLLSFNGKYTFGSRMFEDGNTAADTRLHRGQRRRIIRRRSRLNLLQGFFCEEMEKVDAEFFIRLNQSRLHIEGRKPDHRDYEKPLFNDKNFTEEEFYTRFPTIYHLRAWLTTVDEKADIRLVYLALHHIVKYRGNFLYESMQSLRAGDARVDEAVDALCVELRSWCAQNDIDSDPGEKEIVEQLTSAGATRSNRQKKLQELFGLPKDKAKTLGRSLAGALVGLKAEMSYVFRNDKEDNSKFALSEDEKVEAYKEKVPDDALELYGAMQRVHSAFVLSGMLRGGMQAIEADCLIKGMHGDTLSWGKAREYDKYADDLKILKDLVREYNKDKYAKFFRGDVHNKPYGYTLYNANHGNSSYDTFKKDVKETLAGTGAEDDERYIKMMAELDERSFCRRLRTSDNGVIPYQLHLEEMELIIDRQAPFYPFLADEKEKIESLVTSRIPYYLGPLSQVNAARTPDGKDTRFAWSRHRKGMEDVPVRPWNFKEVIDTDTAAEEFIRRMTGKCTYIMGEDVLPKCSLLYEEFCLLNELNGVKCSVGDSEPHRLDDYRDRQGIINDLFKKKATVKCEDVENWLRRERGHANVKVNGTQGDGKFESKLASYRFFCYDVFHVDCLDPSDYPMVEEIILWSTLFEDRDILRRKLENRYADRLDDEQIKKICKNRFRGWGRFSEKLLTAIYADTDAGPVSIMDVMRGGDPMARRTGVVQVFAEVYHNNRLKFSEIVDQENKGRLNELSADQIQDLPGSPALRRTVNQAVRVVDEITHIAGNPPACIFIEKADDKDPKRKGKRTDSRYKRVETAVEAFAAENAELVRSLGKVSPDNYVTDEVMLYFMQGGKSLYSGDSIDFDMLLSRGVGKGAVYQIDHIIPRAYTKDDSLDNKALVLASENQAKGDDLFVTASVQRKMKDYWESLCRAGLMSDKKFRAVMRTGAGEQARGNFIARQLVETRQVVKLTRMVLESKYPETRVHGVNASLTHELRKKAGFVKCRDINDYHHAHDALIVAEIGRFIMLRYPMMFDEPVFYAMTLRDYVKKQARKSKEAGRLADTSSLVVAGFMRPGIDKVTGEVLHDDMWDPDFELGRIRAYLDCKQIFISRMPEETSGAFWGETIYSPKSKKELLPLKRNLNPRCYGGYTSVQNAYYFIYEERDKKGKNGLVFAPVPVSLAGKFDDDVARLECYARSLAESEAKEFERIVRKKIYKYQQIEVNGERFYVTELKAVRNARQLAFAQKETKVISEFLKGEKADDEEVKEMFRGLQSKFTQMAPRLASVLRIDMMLDAFMAASPEGQRQVLRALLWIVSGKNNRADMRAVGGKGRAGSLSFAYNKHLNSSEGITFIDQSVTGMYETRTRIGL